MSGRTVLTKQSIRLGQTTVAYLDEGAGPPLLLLHGCPFSSFIWRKVIARLRDRFRCIAPDLLGSGDTETPPPISPTPTAEPRPGVSWPGSSTRSTTVPPPTRWPACGPSTIQR